MISKPADFTLIEVGSVKEVYIAELRLSGLLSYYLDRWRANLANLTHTEVGYH